MGFRPTLIWELYHSYFQSFLEIILCLCFLSPYFCVLSKHLLFLMSFFSAMKDCMPDDIFCSLHTVVCTKPLKYTERFTCFLLVITSYICMSPCILCSVTSLAFCNSAEESANCLTYLPGWWRCRHYCLLEVISYVFTAELSKYNSANISDF